MLVNAIVFDVTETRCKVFILYQQQSFKKPGAGTPVATCQYSMEYNFYLLYSKRWENAACSNKLLFFNSKELLNMSEIDFFIQG